MKRKGKTGPHSLYQKLKRAGWTLDRHGWHKRHWFCTTAVAAQAIEVAFKGQVPHRVLANSFQVERARRAVECAEKGMGR